MPSDTANMIFNSNVILLILRTQAKVQPTLNFLFLMKPAASWLFSAVGYGFHDFQLGLAFFDLTYASVRTDA
jgi:hypothetical protein